VGREGMGLMRCAWEGKAKRRIRRGQSLNRNGFMKRVGFSRLWYFLIRASPVLIA
jgi:hypothetical protein